MILIGVDAGATRTRAAVWREGERLGYAEGPGAAVKPGRALQSAAQIAATAKAALAKANFTFADYLVVGVAGAGRAEDAEVVRQALRGEGAADRVHVTTDVELALAAAADADLVLMAGTGSVAIARGAQGPTRLGGHGWQMGDEGGGYWIGREALAAVARAADGRGEETLLTAALMKVAAAPAIRELAAWAVLATPREVASLTRAVAEAERAGDAVARSILDRAATELVALTQALARRRSGTIGQVALGGGLLDPDGVLRDRVAADLAQAGFAVDDRRLDPLAGAAPIAEARGKR